MDTQFKDFKVAIIGGGIGGLILAVALTRGGVKVDIFEQAVSQGLLKRAYYATVTDTISQPKFEEIGAGVAFGSNATRALETLGILDAILEGDDGHMGERTFRFLSGLPGHKEIFDYPARDCDVSVALHRHDLLDKLINLIPQGTSYFGKKCNNVMPLPSGEVKASFEDGTTHTANVVVGCDGIKSFVRSVVVGEPSTVKYTRTVAYRGLIPIDNAIASVGEIAQRPFMFCGLDRHIVVYPIRSKTLINIVAFSTDRSTTDEEQGPAPGEPWVVASNKAEMLSQYEGWGPKSLNLLQNIDNPNKWFLHSQNPPLNSYVRGHIALLGDAAHSMLPHLGAGAGQAVEDALILSQLLTHPLTNASNLEPVLEAYDGVRRPRANRVVTSSLIAGEIYEHRGPSGSSTDGLRRDLADIWDWIWHHNLDADFTKAVKNLESRNVFAP